MDNDKPFMTDAEAEEIYMANELGYPVDRSKVAHALIYLAAREKHYEEMQAKPPAPATGEKTGEGQ
jgi:hypothetical protein